MDARRPLVAGNWKMYKTIAESVAFVRELAALAPDLRDVDALICPPFTALSATHEALAALPAVGLGAQTMWDTDQGAYTGEISPVMLLDAGARWVILGHSERRQLCGETDAGVNRKVIAALRAGLTPIVAVGETAEEHAAGRTQARVTAQARAAFAGVAPSEVGRCVVAYEPIWAIGSGTPDSPASANEVMGTIRHAVPGLAGVRILYGGSVKPDNIGTYVAQPNIDGGLVGSASLDPRSFAGLIANAAATVSR